MYIHGYYERDVDEYCQVEDNGGEYDLCESESEESSSDSSPIKDIIEDYLKSFDFLLSIVQKLVQSPDISHAKIMFNLLANAKDKQETKRYIASDVGLLDVGLENITGNIMCDLLLFFTGEGAEQMVDMILEYVIPAPKLLSEYIYYSSSRLEVVEALIKAGADVNDKVPKGKNALMSACASGKLEIVQTLLENGADVNAKLKGCTALHFAIRGEKIEIVKELSKYPLEFVGEAAVKFLVKMSKGEMLEVVEKIIERWKLQDTESFSSS